MPPSPLPSGRRLSNVQPGRQAALYNCMSGLSNSWAVIHHCELLYPVVGLSCPVTGLFTRLLVCPVRLFCRYFVTFVCRIACTLLSKCSGIDVSCRAIVLSCLVVILSCLVVILSCLVVILSCPAVILSCLVVIMLYPPAGVSSCPILSSCRNVLSYR